MMIRTTLRIKDPVSPSVYLTTTGEILPVFWKHYCNNAELIPPLLARNVQATPSMSMTSLLLWIVVTGNLLTLLDSSSWLDEKIQNSLFMSKYWIFIKWRKCLVYLCKYLSVWVLGTEIGHVTLYAHSENALWNCSSLWPNISKCCR